MVEWWIVGVCEHPASHVGFPWCRVRRLVCRAGGCGGWCVGCCGVVVKCGGAHGGCLGIRNR